MAIDNYVESLTDHVYYSSLLHLQTIEPCYEIILSANLQSVLSRGGGRFKVLP